MIQKTISFIKELYSDQNPVPLHAPVFFGNEKKYVVDCIDTTYVSSVGNYVDRFEEIVATYTASAKAVACVNGTNGLYLALSLCGVEQDDEVITQPVTFVATVNAIMYCRAHPVFIDVDRDTMGLSPERMSDWLDKNAEIKSSACFNRHTGNKIQACVPMHTFGTPGHIDKLQELCANWHIELIEDAAESIGSFFKGKHTGTFGRIGVLSFNGNKAITTGGGGMLLFRDMKEGEWAKHLTTQAKVPHRWDFNHDTIGYNYRMSNINAAIGCAQMENIEVILENKRQTAMKYKQFFKNTEIMFFDEPADCMSNFWLNSIILPTHERQQEFLTVTNDNGVMTRPVWKLMNKLPMFSNCQCGELENAEWFADRVVNIPSGFRISN
ncbi:MAG: LegC family aminotransferase [Treponema sp.]|jgi:aminotransferase in exopolysaccharide biosynthesis|nr:LegC family aminotransferase [Treponema sp.]